MTALKKKNAAKNQVKAALAQVEKLQEKYKQRNIINENQLT